MEYLKPDRFLTLTEFRATGRDVDQATLEEAAGTDLDGGAGGRLYVGNLYIERGTDKVWGLTIMNDSWVAPLRTLEALLYAYARTEILPAPADEQAALIDEWRTFLLDEGLQPHSADEMPSELLGAAQRSYVRGYIKRWESMERRNAPPAYRIRALETALLNLLNAVDAEHPVRHDGKSRLYWHGADAQERARALLRDTR